MQKLTLSQVHSLRKTQEDLNFSKAVYLEFYRKMAKRKYTAELNQLISAEFNRVEVELSLPQLPEKPLIHQEKYTPMLPINKMAEIYESLKTCLL